MKNLVKIINELKNESSRNGKETILKKNKDNKVFREVLSFVFDSFVLSGMSTKKINKNVKGEGVAPLNLSSAMNYLKENNTGRDKDIYVVQGFINNLESDDEKELAKEILSKTLKIGCTSNTINKVYGKGTIKSFNVMLAESYAKKESKVSGKFFLTLKMDGNRCLALKENGKTRFYSRKGKEIEGMSELAEHFSDLSDGWAYDGELLLSNSEGLKSDELFRATQKVVKKDGEKKNLEFYMFDMLPSSEFKNGESKNTYEKRRQQMDLLSGKIKSNSIHVLPVLYEGEDKGKVVGYMKWVEDNGHEGIMVNTANGLYKNKRVSDLLKVKKFLSGDGLVLGVYEGEGKYSGKLGGILVTYKDKGIKVGSGFSDVEREMYWKDKDLIVGRVAEYAYFEESQNQNGGYDLRFCTYKGIREDKNSEDLNYE